MLFSTVLSELVYIRPTVFISYTAMRVVCILFCSFCDHDMVTCSVVRVKSWLKNLGLETQSLGLGLGLDKKSLIYIIENNLADLGLQADWSRFRASLLWNRDGRRPAR